MKKARPTAASSPVGPGRWSFRLYDILERTGPRGRRYEIRSPAKELVAYCHIRRHAEDVSLYADEDEQQEILKFKPKSVRQYASAYDVIDAATGRQIGEFRKKVYRPLNKFEWFIFNADGEPVGMVMEAAPTRSLLGRFVPLPILQARSFEVHWGQAVGGRISRKRALFGAEHVQVDLSLDKKEAIDRRLALGVAVLMRDDERNGDRLGKEREKEPEAEAP